VGIFIDGPSRYGFQFYPVHRLKGAAQPEPGGQRQEPPHIYPDGASHDWALEYDPNGGGGKGQITVTFDGKKNVADLPPGAKSGGSTFDRFGIFTTWIDGNSENVYWDDITYTTSQD
jgi:hypothetical protein